MATNVSISLNDHFENFIRDEVLSGRYESATDVVNTALRLLETEEQKLKFLRSALEEGEKSEMVADFDADQFLKELHMKHL